MLRPFYGSAILRSPDPDPDNTGGGGGGDDNGGYTEAQLKVLGNLVNTVVTSHLKRQPTFAEQLKGVAWDEILAPVVQKLAPQPEPDPSKGKGGGKAGESEYQTQISKLAADLEASNKRATEAESKRAAAENARKVDAGKLRLRSALQGKVNDGAMDHVINHLTLVQNRLTVDDNGNTTLKVKRPAFIGAPPEEVDVDIEDAIKDVLEESDMKVFLPAPIGSGVKNPGPRGPNGQPISFVGEAKTEAEKLARAAAREAEVLAKFGNR